MQILESAQGIEVAGLPYKVIKDRNGVEHKVIDLDNDSLMPRTGQIIYEANKRSERAVVHGYQYSITKDIDSGVLVGILAGIHPETGDLRWQRLTLTNLNTFDLSIRAEREKAIILKYSSVVEGSPNLSPIVKLHLFRVHDSEKAAHNEIQKIQDGQRSISIAMGLYGEDLANMARNLGIMPETISLSMLTAAVLKAAQDKPKEFLTLWENPNRELITILKRCLDTGVISQNPLEGYTYEGRPMGHNEPMVLDFLAKYRDIATTLDMKSRERLKQSEKAMQKAPPMKTVNDVEIENTVLKKQMLEMKERLDMLAAEAIRKDTAEETPELIAELEAKKAEARELGLGKGLHNHKATRESIDKLQAKISATALDKLGKQ